MKIVVADDTPLVFMAIEVALKDVFGEVEIFTCRNGQEAINLCNAHKPYLLITDLNMCPVNGLELCKYVKKEHPEIKIMLVSDYLSGFIARSLKELKVEGIIDKFDTHDLKIAFTNLTQRGKYFSENVLKMLADLDKDCVDQLGSLTESEKEVFKLKIRCFETGEIAAIRKTKVITIEKQIKNYRFKLGIKTNQEENKYVIKHNLIQYFGIQPSEIRNIKKK